ncbi:hypothetical protein EDB85DRAFT_2174185 [Lactarius pseudohatsudake]|nr:hypothetical protein EDB85DRAFT_2174185 [Lactarius pseudohatsudake]
MSSAAQPSSPLDATLIKGLILPQLECQNGCALRKFRLTPSALINPQWLKVENRTSPRRPLQNVLAQIALIQQPYQELRISAARLQIFHRKVQDDNEVQVGFLSRSLFAGTNDESPVLRISRPDVEDGSVVRIFCPSASPVNAPCSPGRDMAYHYEFAHVRSLDHASQATQLAALDAVATAPTIFDFDPVLRLDSVLAAQPHAEARGQGRAACSTSSPSCNSYY